MECSTHTAIGGTRLWSTRVCVVNKHNFTHAQMHNHVPSVIQPGPFTCEYEPAPKAISLPSYTAVRDSHSILNIHDRYTHISQHDPHVAMCTVPNDIPRIDLYSHVYPDRAALARYSLYTTAVE